MRLPATIAACAALLLPAVPAAALDADSLKRDLEAYAEELRLEVPRGGLQFGEIAVAEEGDGLRVSVPDIVIGNPLENEQVEVGTLSFLVAEPEPGSYAFSDVVVPEELAILGPGGEERGSLRFRLERLSGIFDSDLGELTALDFLLRGLELRIPREALVIGFADASGFIETLPESAALDSRYRQSQSFRIADLVVSGAAATVEFGEIAAEAEIAGLDLQVYGAFMAILDDLETAAEQGDVKRLEALRQAMAGVSHLAVTLDQRVVLRDIAAFGPGGRDAMTLDELEFGLDVGAPLESDVGSASFRFAGRGFRPGTVMQEDAGDYLDLIPRDWSLPFTIEKVPLSDLSSAFVDLVFGLSLDPFSRIPLESAGSSLLAAMGKAGTLLIVRDLFIEAPLGRTDAKASLSFAPDTPLGVVGMAEFVMTGLDKILVYAEGLSDPEAKRWISTAVLGLMGMGKATALPDGRVGYGFTFFFSPEGEVSMNGFGFGDMLNEAIPQ